MGKSTSCLRIIPCAGGSTDPHDQGSKAKKGWSFKKRSSSARCLSNSVIVETPSPRHKENLESAAIKFENASDSIVSDKESALHWDEKKPQLAPADSYVADAVTVSETEKLPAAIDSHATDHATVSNTEKLPDTADSGVTEPVAVSTSEEDKAVFTVDESVVILMQSAIRGFLARKEQIKLKNVVSLQAAVRGHLVRCHAIGALRCVQAIAKMQVLIRARYVRLSSEEQAVESNGKGTRARKDRKLPKVKPEITYTSMDELLKSSFARQLLESSPKSKAIKIKCDPLRRDSSWVWLERWMSLASPGAVADRPAEFEKGEEEKHIEEDQEENTIEKEQEEKISIEDYLFHEENEIFSEAKDHMNSSRSFDYSKLTVIEETNPISIKITNSDEDRLSASFMARQNPDKMGDLDIDTVGAALEVDSVEHTVDSQPKIDSVNVKPEFETEQAKELEADVKPEQEMGTEDNIVSKSVTDCRLPAIAVKSEIENLVSVQKSASLCDSEPELVSVPNSAIISDSISITQNATLEELVSVPNSAILCDDLVSPKAEVNEPVSIPNLVVNYNSVPQNVEVEELIPHSAEFDVNMETATASSGDDIIINHNEPSQHELSSIQVGESECGTELSVTSTLDSPDRSEIGPVGFESERVDSKDADSHIPEQSNIVKVEIKTESGSVEKETSAECATAVHIGMEEKELETKASNLELPAEVEGETKPETDILDLTAESERDAERSHQASPGASSRSQVTFTESQGTPSSQVSVSTKTKRSKTEKSGSIKKWTIMSASKRSPLTNDSGGKSSADKPTKDRKSVKRRTSFGSDKPDIVDEEQRRDSITSSSLPSYMQATESARAKANAGHSPRSSPDVADKDAFLRKRPSLSGAKDRKESPRLRQTSSQAQPGSKSNGTSPHERKWQR